MHARTYTLTRCARRAHTHTHTHAHTRTHTHARTHTACTLPLLRQPADGWRPLCLRGMGRPGWRGRWWQLQLEQSPPYHRRTTAFEGDVYPLTSADGVCTAPAPVCYRGWPSVKEATTRLQLAAGGFVLYSRGHGAARTVCGPSMHMVCSCRGARGLSEFA